MAVGTGATEEVCSVKGHRKASIGNADDTTTVRDDDLGFLEDPEFLGHFRDAQIRSELLGQLVEARNAVRLTQAQIASAMGTTQSAISELESGATDPRLSTLQRYARAVGSEVHASLKATGVQELFESFYSQTALMLGPLGEAAAALAPASSTIEGTFIAVRNSGLLAGDVPPVKPVKEVQVSDVWDEVA
jgi:transcriptional regulator with XRE-family HTH domain